MRKRNIKCRLCTHLTGEGHQYYLLDADGQNTDVYKLTVKYFDAVLINIDDNKHDAGITSDSYIFSQAICHICWGYISEFNDFQQRVLRTVQQLMEDNNSCVVGVNEDREKHEHVKVQNDDDLSEMNAIGGEIVLIVENGTNEYYQNDGDETEDNVKDKTSQNVNIKSNQNKYEDAIKIYDFIDSEEDLKKTENDKVNITTKESPKSLKKLRCRKVNPKEKSNCNDKSVPYKVQKESSKSPLKRRCRKVSPDENRGTKSTHYNSLNSIQKINNYIKAVMPQLECDLCKESLTSYNELCKHFKDKHQVSCFVVCCGKKFYRRYLLAEHLRLHVNPNIFKCDICDVISSSSRAFYCHKRFMHGEIKMLECEVCHKQFKTQPVLNRHMDIHNDGSKDFKCPECDRCYSSDYQLKAHISKVHNEKQICEQCGKEVHGKTALNRHIIHHHGGIKPKKFFCDKCDAKLATKNGLKAHQLAFHNDLRTAFICKVCGKISSSITALQYHKKYVHEMERKHKCQYCDKAFKKISNLKEHINVHTGELLYQCYHCPLTFGNSANMHKHRKNFHPTEFALAREKRVVAPKIDLNRVTNEVHL